MQGFCAAHCFANGTDPEHSKRVSEPGPPMAFRLPFRYTTTKLSVCASHSLANRQTNRPTDQTDTQTDSAQGRHRLTDRRRERERERERESGCMQLFVAAQSSGQWCVCSVLCYSLMNQRPSPWLQQVEGADQQLVSLLSESIFCMFIVIEIHSLP